MKTIALWFLCGSAGLVLWRSPGSQQPQSPPQGPPPAQTPAQLPAPTTGATPGATPQTGSPAAPAEAPARGPLEGFYALHSRTIDGTSTALRSRGYVAITRRHMMMCFVGEGADPDKPLLRAGVRSWEAAEHDQVNVECRLGFFTDDKGNVHVEPPGTAEVKRIERIRGGIRIWQDDRSYLDFERLE